jgi:hypothetical protein
MGVIEKLSSNARRRWRLPGDLDRVSIVGKTGSGKTTAGLFLLNEMNSFTKMPWIIVDYKRDDFKISPSLVSKFERTLAARRAASAGAETESLLEVKPQPEEKPAPPADPKRVDHWAEVICLLRSRGVLSTVSTQLGYSTITQVTEL